MSFFRSSVGGGCCCADLSQGPLYGELARLVPNFSHNLGRTDAIALYARHLQSIHDEAGKAAVAQWLEANRSV